MTLIQGLEGHHESITWPFPEGQLHWVTASVDPDLRGPANWESALCSDKPLLFQPGHM